MRVQAVPPLTTRKRLVTERMTNGATHYPATARPLPTQPGDGRQWVTGMCWLYCRRNGIPVIWLGPVHSSGMAAPLFGCAQCIAELDHMVWRYVTAKDRA
ncbi:hypothetical protein GCM10009753_06670 [Streptantibioticus ferralitis]